MSTIAREFTKEQLQQIIETDHVQCGEASSLARFALASLEAEAVSQPIMFIDGDISSEGADKLARVIREFNEEDERPLAKMARIIRENPHPTNECDMPRNAPAPVSVPAAMEIDDDFDSAFEHGKAVGWNAYRAAMLQSFGNSEQLNSPVIPDGWVMVPIEPTAEMLQSGISAHYERSQTQIHDRPAPGPMECAYVAMLAAAPQQEVK